MANTKSSKKDLRRTAKRTVANRTTKSALKTFVKKARQAMATGEAEPTTTALTQAVKALDKAAQRGVIHKNQAARRKSRIAKAAAAAVKAGPPAAVEKVERKAKAAKGHKHVKPLPKPETGDVEVAEKPVKTKVKAVAKPAPKPVAKKAADKKPDAKKAKK